MSQQLGISSAVIATAIGREINNKTYDDYARIFFDSFFKQPSNYTGKNDVIHQELELLPRDGAVTNADRINYLIARDVGPGKIQVRTAINLLDAYFDDFRDDPLELSRFEGDYALFASELANWSSETSVKVAGLMVLRAKEYFESNIDGWNSWTEDERNAAQLAYYSRGEAAINGRIAGSGLSVEDVKHA